MHIRYDDPARKFEQIELKFHIRNIFASDQIGSVKEVKVSLREPVGSPRLSLGHSPVHYAKKSEWLIEVPPRRTGEFVCTRMR